MPVKRDDDGMVYASRTLLGALEAMSPADVERAFAAFQHWERECKHLDEVGDPLSIAYSFHEVVDDCMSRMLVKSRHAESVSCRKGCASCCHVYVGIFAHEARLLWAAAAEAGIKIDEERLARQAQKTEDTWGELSPEDRRCVFLGDDRTCQVYEHRPTGCRKYLVKSDPALCDVDKHVGGQVTAVYSLEAEISHSAAMTVFSRGSDNMAHVLLAVRDNDSTQ